LVRAKTATVSLIARGRFSAAADVGWRCGYYCSRENNLGNRPN
jgi:hypothetical protein